MQNQINAFRHSDKLKRSTSIQLLNNLYNDHSHALLTQGDTRFPTVKIMSWIVARTQYSPGHCSHHTCIVQNKDRDLL